MRPLTATAIAHIVDGRLAGDGATVVTRVFTDSRQVVAGGLFFALRGERFDGHTFVADVLARGAAGAVIRRGSSTLGDDQGRFVIEVDDPQRALGALGAALRNLHPGRFVAVTGSVGKTTTKDMIAATLSGFGKVGKTPGNLNNHIGVPLTLAGLDGDEAFVVIEMGMSAPGEIARLTHMVRPDLGVVTRAAAAHLEFFPSVDAIADAKAELYAHLPPAAIAIANADDPRMLARAQAYAGGRLVTFGGLTRDRHLRERDPRGQGASAGREEATSASPHDRPGEATPAPRVAAAKIRVIGAGHSSGKLVVTLAGADSFANGGLDELGELEVHLDAIGVHNAENVAAAIACAVALRLDPLTAAAALQTGFRAPKHRLEVVRAAGVVVLDDCYNANPTSTRAALDAFADVMRNVPLADRLVVLGSMRELGPTANALHAEIGVIAGTIAGHVVATGAHAEALATTARAAGAEVHAGDDVAALMPTIDRFVASASARGGGAILLKGSRGERLERVLEHLHAAATAATAAAGDTATATAAAGDTATATAAAGDTAAATAAAGDTATATAAAGDTTAATAAEGETTAAATNAGSPPEGGA